MQARFHDGLTARSLAVEVMVEVHRLSFEADGDTHVWSLADLQVEDLGDRLRLSHPKVGDGRLTLEASDWRASGGGAGIKAERRHRSRETRLVVGLAVAGLAIAAVVFIGVPAASGPLARATPPEIETRMGRNFEAQLSIAFRPCEAGAGQAALAAFGERLETAADTPFDIRVRAVQAPMVNAFALPGGAVMVTDDLIALARTPDELAAVISHEAAHVERRHVMQAVWRSLGLGLVLDAVVGGGSGAGQQAVLLAGSVADLRFSRSAEREADVRGQQLLEANGLSSQGMAPFFQRIASKGEGPGAVAVKELMSSHPDSQRRAQESAARAHPGAPAFTPAEWAAIKSACQKPKRTLQQILKNPLGG
ncbi:M48 family metallopeptidase [Phenylobacterium sp.]|uniref:M48 family metallopeptidase n=1 Tax=Phenylobacterium sp. TaxID=1871053 RepID=UPI0030F3F809